jgi:outer membrane protein TolC
MPCPVAFLWVLALLLGGSAAVADPQPHRYALEELVTLALERHAEVAQARWRVEGAVARLRQARAARILPRLRLESQSGLVPEAKGDIFNPPGDTVGVRPLGPFNRTELEFAQPLYTFGWGPNLLKAAENGLVAEEEALGQTRLEVAFEIKKLYYGLLLAQDLLGLVQRLSDTLQEKRSEVEGDEALPLSSRYQLELALLELERREREATDQLELARRALAWSAGLPAESTLELDAEWLAAAEAQVPSLEELTARVLVQRPDWRRLQAGLAARKSLHQAAQSAYYPQVFLAGGLRYAVAPGRTDQHNPFVKDEFNFFNGAVFLGVRQSLEWGLLGAEADKARAEYRELKAKEQGAAEGIRLELRRAYLDFQRAQADLEAAEKERQLARQWLKQAQDEYEFDPGEIKELVTAFETWARLEQAHYQSIYDFNLRLARLEQVAGGIELSKK